LVDTYRSKFSNPADFPGITWTTIESSDEVYDRIDMIYHTSSNKYDMKDVRLVEDPVTLQESLCRIMLRTITPLWQPMTF
jgi:hypothetical protein